MRKSSFLILCFEGAVLSFNVAACAALIPSISRAFQTSEFITGKVVWFYMLPYGIAALFYGPLARRFAIRKIALATFLFFSLANFLAAVSFNLRMLFIARTLMGVFGAAVIPLALIFIARHTQANRRGSQVGLFFSITFAASLSGLLLSAFIPWRMIFFIPAIGGFFLWGYMYLFFPSFQPEGGSTKVNYLAAFKNKRVFNIFLYIFLISLLYHSIQQWLSVYYSRSYYFSQTVISLLITFTSFSGIFGEFLGGRFADTMGRSRTVMLGIILMAVSAFLFIFKMPLAFLALLMIIWGFGWTINHAGLSTMLTDLPGEFLNEAASLNSSVRFVSGGMGMAVAGLVMQRNFTLGFILAGLGLVTLATTSKFLFSRDTH